METVSVSSQVNQVAHVAGLCLFAGCGSGLIKSQRRFWKDGCTSGLCWTQPDSITRKINAPSL
jgi:hypothetical protein